MAQFARPDTDISKGGWTASTGTDLWEMINETPASDTDYARSGDNPTTAETYEAALSSVTDPVSSTGHVVRYRYQKNESGGGKATGIDLTVYLVENTTVIASQAHTDISVGYLDGSFTLTAGEADSITDYTDLRLRFTAQDDASGARTSWAEVSFSELEVPNVASDRRIFIIS